LRAHAIKLFGALHRFGEGPCKALLYDQIQANLVSLILHLNDTDAEVKKVRSAMTIPCSRALGELHGF
jgi:maestro heat-like repeat-containing protein family member 1